MDGYGGPGGAAHGSSVTGQKCKDTKDTPGPSIASIDIDYMCLAQLV